MRLDFETGVAVGQALEAIKSLRGRVRRVEGRVDRIELIQRGLLLLVLLGLAVASNLAPREAAEITLSLIRAWRGG